MQTGVLTQESLAQVLRGVSQRRRQGCLEVRYTDRSVRILFIQGKIAEFLEQGINPAQEVCRMLQAAGMLELEFSCKASNYLELWTQISGSSHLDPNFTLDLFKETLKHRVLDKLYRLDVNCEAFFSFDAAMVEVERDFVPYISVGQLLLDLVALDCERPKFLELFQEDFLISRLKTGAELGLVNEEQHILNCLAEPLTVAQVKTRSLLSSFTLQECLMHLHSRELIQVAKPAPMLSSDEFLDEGLLKGLDDSIDAAFNEEALLQKTNSAEQLQDSISTTLDQSAPLFSQGRQQGVFRQRMALLSSRMMHMYWIPALVMLSFLTAAIIVPLFIWQPVFEAFK